MKINSVSDLKSGSVADIFNAAKDGELDYASVFRSKQEEMTEKLEKGETEEKFQIGASEYTIKEWDRFMRTIDKAQEKIKGELEEREEKNEKKRLTKIMAER